MNFAALQILTLFCIKKGNPLPKRVFSVLTLKLGKCTQCPVTVCFASRNFTCFLEAKAMTGLQTKLDRLWWSALQVYFEIEKHVHRSFLKLHNTVFFDFVHQANS